MERNRRKKAFSSNYEIMHVYAQRTHAEGHTPNNAVFFENDRIYSWGYHYLLGEFITNDANDMAIMINDVGYSSSTGRHISILRGATTQHKQFLATQSDGRLVFIKMEELFNKRLRARKPIIYILEAELIYRHYKEFLKWSNKKCEYEERIANMVESFRDEGLIAQENEHLAKAREKARKKIAVNIERFINHETNYVNDSKEAFIRISEDGRMVETTKGAKVPVEEALILYKLIKAGRDIKGHRIGYYTVIGLNGTLKIGCHNINKANMVTIGEQLLVNGSKSV